MLRSDLHKLKRGDKVKVRLWLGKRPDGRGRRRALPNARAEYVGFVRAVSDGGGILVSSRRGTDWRPYHTVKPLSGLATD